MINYSKLKNIVYAWLVVILVSACGWQLKGFNQGALPESLTLKTSDPFAPLARQLQQTLVRRGITLSPSAPVTLWLDDEKQQKRIVAVTGIGSAAQYELVLSVSYKYFSLNEQVVLPQELNTQRIYDFTPGSNLAKVEEEQSLLREMRQELIARIISQAPRQQKEAAFEDDDKNSLLMLDVNSHWRAGQEPLPKPPELPNSSSSDQPKP